MAPDKQIAEEHPSLQKTKALGKELNKTGRELNAANADFLKVDAETALTFTQLALDTDNEEKKQRNCKNARKAYDSILHLRKNVTFTSTQEAYLEEMLSRLKHNLTSLGEKF
jgi:hypothetical protein